MDARGIISDTALASAELFDPATDAFSDAGALTTDRSQHAATLLTDGRVLLVGGHNRDGSPSTAELFDPETRAFVRGADTLDPLGNVTAALLRDGHVFVVGQVGPPELFDPSTSGHASPPPGPRNAGLAGSVTTIDGPAVQRYAHTATLLFDGRVLVVGGNVDEETRLDSAELYDPQTGRWSATGSLNEPRARHIATLLDDGRVLVAGGGAFETPEAGGEFIAEDSAELYDPATGRFTPAGRMTVGRSVGFLPGGVVWRPSVTSLPDGLEMIVGGSTEPMIDVFDPLTNTFTGIRSGCVGATVMLPDGRVLLGCERGPIFDPSTGQLVGVANARVVRNAGTTLPDGRIVLSDALGNVPLVFDPRQAPDNPDWLNLDVLLRETVEGGLSIQTTTALPDGRILVFARNPYDRHPMERGFAAIFDPRLGTFTEVASPAGRHASTATLLPTAESSSSASPTDHQTELIPSRPPPSCSTSSASGGRTAMEGTMNRLWISLTAVILVTGCAAPASGDTTRAPPSPSAARSAAPSVVAPSPAPSTSSGECADSLAASDGRIAFKIQSGEAGGIASINADGSAFRMVVELALLAPSPMRAPRARIGSRMGASCSTAIAPVGPTTGTCSSSKRAAESPSS